MRKIIETAAKKVLNTKSGGSYGRLTGSGVGVASSLDK